MTKRPQTWHYGLIARWWAEFNTDGPEIEYFKTLIEQYGQPALDVACGTGRLLIPYLRAGLDVDGCDLSADMLALCQARAKKEGLLARLYQQPMHELELSRTYKTIIVCGGFGIGGTREQDRQALKRFHHHLQPGGALLLDHHLPYKEKAKWGYWLKEERQKLPEPWPTEGVRKRAQDGDELELRYRLAAFDPLEQLATRQIRALLWRDGKLVRQEEYTLLDRDYFRNELFQMLQVAGFRHVHVREGYTQADATADSEILVFIARK